MRKVKLTINFYQKLNGAFKVDISYAYYFLFYFIPWNFLLTSQDFLGNVKYMETVVNWSHQNTTRSSNSILLELKFDQLKFESERYERLYVYMNVQEIKVSFEFSFGFVCPSLWMKFSVLSMTVKTHNKDNKMPQNSYLF